MNPRNNSVDVPVNAVIRVVLKSEAKIDEDSLNSEKFILSVRTPLTQIKTKTENSTETAGSKEANAETSARQIKGLIMSKSSTIQVDTDQGQKEKIQTIVYFIPIPDKNSDRPLEPETPYQFQIRDLEDDNGNVLLNQIFFFKTGKADFKFKKEGNATLISPEISTSDLSYISTREKFFFAVDAPVNPFLLKSNSKFESDTKLDAQQQKDDVTQESLEKEIENLTSKYEEIEKSIKDEEAKSEKNEGEIIKLKSRLEVIADEITSKSKQLETMQIDTEGKDDTGKDPQITEIEPRTFGFSMYFVEDFEAQQEQIEESNQSGKESKKFITAKYNKVLVTSNLKERFVYDFTLQVNKDKQPLIFLESMISDEKIQPQTSIGENMLLLNFSGDNDSND